MSREQSAIIKGVAILLMLIYHVDDIIGIHGLDNGFYQTLITASHPINYFLIVSGYGLYCSFVKNRITWSYLIKRSLKLYLAFWLVLSVFVFGLASWLYPGRFAMPWHEHVLNVIGWRWDYCLFTWFLLPYVLMSFTAKWIFRIIDRLGNVLSLVSGMCIYVFTSFLISRYFESWLQYHYEVYHVVLWAQTLFGLTIGAVMARMYMAGKSITLNQLYGKNLLIITLLIFSFALRGLINTSVLNPFHASLVVWLILHLNFSEMYKTVFVELGDKSMIMWFAQGFLGAKIFSEYILLLHWPWLIWVVWLLVCYIVACMFKPVVNGMARALKLS